jgi:uncharacterized protein (TIGR03118 family)
VGSFLVFLWVWFGAVLASAQSTAYRQTNLTSDVPGAARNRFSSLVNPWGMAYGPGLPFWVSENGIGVAGQYDGTGILLNSAGLLPGMVNSSHPLPTGVAYNPIAEDFVVRHTPAQFIFVTADGTIQTWANENGDIPTTTTMALDFSAAGSVYTGVAILNPPCCREYLAIADFRHNLIHTFDVQFDLLGTLGDFTDPHLPQGFSAFNIQQIGTQVFVTYAEIDSASGRVVTGASQGFVSLFDQEGNFVQRFASNGPLNAPWGIVRASANFGPFSNAILIGNFGDGAINAFDPTGNFLGSVQDARGATIENPGLWSLAFRTDGLGNPNALYFTAGVGNQQHGLLGAITVDPVSGPPDFNLSASPTSATIPIGQSANFTLTALPTGGFSGSVQFSCSAPAGFTCSLSPSAAPTSGGVASSILTVTAPAVPGMASAGTWEHTDALSVLLATLLMFCAAMAQRGTRAPRRSVWCARAVLVLASLMAAVSTAGCGSYGRHPAPNPNPMSVLVTAQSGSVAHTATVSVAVR